MKATVPTKIKDIEHKWHQVDVEGKILGREATKIAQLLTGKNKPYFVRHLDCGDSVVVINAQKVKVSGKKMTEKIYTSYSGYPGGLRSENFRDLLARDPQTVIRRAVLGMLPKNKLRDLFIKRLHVYPSSEHPYKNEVSKI